MKKIMMLSAAHPGPILAVLGLITLAALASLGELRVRISAESLFIKITPEWQFYQQIEQTFGSDSITVVFLRDRELFQTDKLIAIKEVLEAIDALPFVERTSSLYSARNVKNEDGFITVRPYLGEIPTDSQSLESIRRDAVQNPLIVGNLLAADATAMAINIYFKTDQGKADFDAEATLAIEHAIAPLKGQLDEVFQIGSAYVRDALTRSILGDQLVVVPLSLAVLLLALALSLRRIHGAVIPLLTAGLSVIWTLALMASLQIPVNVMTSIVPALLIIIGSTEDIHLLAEYQAGIAEGILRTQAVEQMSATMGTAVLLTFITTYLGFLSIALNDIELLRQFGLVASTGLFLNFVITVLLVPIYLRFFGNGSHGKTGPSGLSSYTRLAEKMLHFVIHNRIKIFVAVLVCVLLSAYGAWSLRVNNNAMGYFNKESSVRLRADTLHDRLSGLHTFSVVIDSGIEDTFLQVRYLAEIRKLQDHIANMEVFDHAFSFADFLSLIHNVMDDETQQAKRLPDSDDIVREYMLFVKQRDVREYVSPAFDRARIVVRHNISSSYELEQAVQNVRDFAQHHLDPALRVQITGEALLANQAADSMAYAQAQSLSMMVVTIFLIVSVLFVNLKAGLIAIVPNLIPVLALFGVMGFAGIPLDSGTSMVAAIALGICVDDTMHFMARYHQQLQVHREEFRALQATVSAEVMPIVATSVALAAGFATLATSSFVPVIYFGLLSAMVICLALLATFLLTPPLLSKTRLITAWDLLSMRVKRDCLQRCALFRDMKLWQIKKVLLVIDVREYLPGKIIIEQGEPGKEVFIVLEGRAEVRKKRADGTLMRLNNLSMGDTFGEVALLSKRPRTAQVIAVETTRVLSLSWDSIERLRRIFPHLSVKLFRNLSAIVGDKLAQADARYIPLKDGLTGLYTSDFALEQIKTEISRLKRYRGTLSVIVLSIHINNEAERAHGAYDADSVLRELADRAREHVRGGDIVARWTSDAFILLFPRTHLKDAWRISERLKKLANPEHVLTAGVTHWTNNDNMESFLSRVNHVLTRVR